ncbi:c-type cytochrome [Antarctobacter heliothermus]|uniref:Cytochrome c, mono- and diheme variants n=1 Tax=Antarctobacter heliothermus TaxID=74033 RepID=A0A239L7P8_9RHOB|nr:Cytochrome c, mono- and diheme variants [Antarctobacter heliothermus]
MLAVLVTGAYLGAEAAADAESGAMPNNVDIVVGQDLYAETCAACHGANLEGQENWQSPREDGRLPGPPHDETGHTWHHSDQLLFGYTKLGGREVLAAQGMEFDSGMPGFADRLTDQEIWNILGYIKSTWPERIQKMQTERTKDETRSRED